MTELSFLLELFLDKELPCSMMDKLVSRIREVEANLVAGLTTQVRIPINAIPNMPGICVPKQAPSTLAAMARHGELPIIQAPQMPPPEPVAVIAQNPVTAAAMNHRNQTIADAIAGKTDKVTGRPRKW